jgi:hypothetical protein
VAAAPGNTSVRQASETGATAGTTARHAAFAEIAAAPVASVGFLVRAWVGIFAVEASLRVVGYRRTLRWIERVPPRRGAAGVRAASPRTSVSLGERLVRKAYLGHALPGGCLPRSLVQYLLHRRDGTSARLVVGVRRPDPGHRARTTSGDRAPAKAGDRAPATSGDRAPANETLAPSIEAHAWVESDVTAPAGVGTFAPIFSSGDSR